MKKYCQICIIGLLLLFPLGCKETPKKVIETVPVAFTKEGELSIYGQVKDSLLAELDIEIADSDYETQTGLMYREEMYDNQGMLFVFNNEALHSFYMKNTEIPLDLVFIQSNLKVGSITENAQPLDETGISSRVPVQYVLEVNAGLAKKWGLQVGDSIAFSRTN